MNKIFKYFFDKNYRFLVNANHGLYNYMSDKKYLKRKFYAQNKVKLNLDNPLTFNDKLNWLKLYDRNDEYIKMVNKYTAKQWISDRIGDKYIIPTIGVWEKVSDINFDELPQQFVIKCTHASGANIICTNKSKLDIRKLKKKLNKWMRKNWFWYGREWPYLNCKHQIIVEKFMVDDNDNTGDSATTDYKFFCFNGEPKVMYISKDKSHDPRTDFFDMNFNHLPIVIKDPNSDKLPEKPDQFEEMIELSKKLSVGFRHIRIDFYVFNSKIYVGELTFYHCSGFSIIKPYEWNVKMGEWISIKNDVEQ